MPKVEQFSIDVRKFTTIALILPNSVLSVIGPEYFLHLTDQSDSKLKPIMIWSPAFSLVSCSLPVFTLSLNWLMMMSTFVAIGSGDYLRFGFRNSTENCSNTGLHWLCFTRLSNSPIQFKTMANHDLVAHALLVSTLKSH